MRFDRREQRTKESVLAGGKQVREFAIRRPTRRITQDTAYGGILPGEQMTVGRARTIRLAESKMRAAIPIG